MDDGTPVDVGFTAKNETRSAVAVQHFKLPDKATADRRKAWWAERFDALSELLDQRWGISFLHLLRCLHHWSS